MNWIALLSPGLPWFIALAWLGFARNWRWAIALNALPVALTIFLVFYGMRLGRDENSDQSALGGLIIAAIVEAAALASVASTAIGAALGALYRNLSARRAPRHPGEAA